MCGRELARAVMTALLDGSLDFCGRYLAFIICDRRAAGNLVDCHCRHTAELRQLLFDPKSTERRQQLTDM